MNDYPSNWDQLRKQAYERDDYQCRNCKIKGGKHGDVTLHAHHIVPREVDGNDTLSNLATLCESCHAKIHPHLKNDIETEFNSPDTTLNTNYKTNQSGSNPSDTTAKTDSVENELEVPENNITSDIDIKSDVSGESGYDGFTGTAVETGDTVVLDNGWEIVKLQTSKKVQLGKEYTISISDLSHERIGRVKPSEEDQSVISQHVLTVLEESDKKLTTQQVIKRVNQDEISVMNHTRSRVGEKLQTLESEGLVELVTTDEARLWQIKT